MIYRIPLCKRLEATILSNFALFLSVFGLIPLLLGEPMSTFARNWFIFWLALASLRFVVLGYWTRFYVQTYRVDEEGIALLRNGTETSRVPWDGMYVERTLLPVEHATWQLRSAYIFIALFLGYFPPVYIKGREQSRLEVPWWGGTLRQNPVLMAFSMHGPQGNAVQQATRVVPIPVVPRTAPAIEVADPGMPTTARAARSDGAVTLRAESATPEIGRPSAPYIVGTPDVSLFPIRFIIGNFPLFFGVLSLTLLPATDYFLPVSLVFVAVGLWISAKCMLILASTEKLPWRYSVTEEGIQRVYLNGQVIAYPWALLVRVTSARSGFIPSLIGLLRELAMGPRPVSLLFSDGAELVLPRAPRLSFYQSRLEDVRSHCAMMGPDNNLLYRACLEDKRFCKYYRGRGSRVLRAALIASLLPLGSTLFGILSYAAGDPPTRGVLPIVLALLALTALHFFLLLNGGPVPRIWTQEEYRAQVRGDREAEANP